VTLKWVLTSSRWPASRCPASRIETLQMHRGDRYRQEHRNPGGSWPRPGARRSCVIADPDGGYLGYFHDSARGDVILNPFDARSLKWDLFAEIANDYDVEHLRAR